MGKLAIVLCIFLMLGSFAFAQGSEGSNLRVGMVTDEVSKISAMIA